MPAVEVVAFDVEADAAADDVLTFLFAFAMMVMG